MLNAYICIHLKKKKKQRPILSEPQLPHELDKDPRLPLRTLKKRVLWELSHRLVQLFKLCTSYSSSSVVDLLNGLNLPPLFGLPCSITLTQEGEVVVMESKPNGVEEVID